jgi:hypothetical protein
MTTRFFIPRQNVKYQDGAHCSYSELSNLLRETTCPKSRRHWQLHLKPWPGHSPAAQPMSSLPNFLEAGVPICLTFSPVTDPMHRSASASSSLQAHLATLVRWFAGSWINAGTQAAPLMRRLRSRQKRPAHDANIRVRYVRYGSLKEEGKQKGWGQQTNRDLLG